MFIQKKREAFSMFVAIVVIVIMATVAMLIMSMTGKVLKETTAQYQREQASLLANSYTEYAVMAVTANDRTPGNCLSTINGTWNGYSARINIAYIGDPATIGNCAGQILSQAVITTETPLTIIVDAYIDYNDLDNPAAPQIVYHRRTVQKI